MDRAGQSGPGLLAGSRAQILQAGMRLRTRYLSLVFRQERRSERFTEPLAYLATPHRARTVVHGVDIIPDLSGKTNLKVVVSLDHRKISSPDISRPALPRASTSQTGFPRSIPSPLIWKCRIWKG